MVLMEKTISQVLLENVRLYPDYLAIVSDRKQTKISWKILDEMTSNIAKNLKYLGMEKGDRIAIISANSTEWVLTFFACMKLGMTVVPINTNFKDEIEYVLREAQCKAVFFQEQFRNNDILSTIKTIKGKSLVKVQHYINMSGLRKGFLSFDQLIQPCEMVFEEVDETCHEIAVILFTSGTTSFPKGVMLSHYNLLNNALALKEAMDLSEEDSICLAPPLFHCFGLTASMLVATLCGAKMVILKECGTKSLVEALANHECSVLNGVPTMFTSLIHYAELSKYDLSALTKGIIAGSKYSTHLFYEISAKLNMPYLMSSYGQTECSPACTISKLTDNLKVRSETVGQVIPFVEMEIRHPITKEKMRQGLEGELCVKGYNVMKGYCNVPSEEVIDKEGWLYTGDLGSCDERGRYKITGRIKDLIIRGGENISPFEIEEVINQVDYVTACQVIGVTDEKYGEQVAACILVTDKRLVNEEALKNFVGKKLAKYKVPKYIFVLDKFTMTASGKVSKVLLKQKIEEILTESKLAKNFINAI